MPVTMEKIPAFALLCCECIIFKVENAELEILWLYGRLLSEQSVMSGLL